MNVTRIATITALAAFALGAGSAIADPVASAENAWLPLTKSAVQPPKDARERRGEEVFQERCAACHAPVPQNMIGPPYMPANPGTQALKARYRDAKPAELEARTDLTAPDRKSTRLNSSHT